MNVVIIGNGAAGNSAAENILRMDSRIRVTLISEEPFPEYSACVLCDYISGELPRQRVFLKNEKDYSKSGIKALLGRKVNELDILNKRLLVEEKYYSYDKLILATGSAPVLPDIKGLNKKGVFFLKTLGDAEAILRHQGKKAVVIGSGPIGIEAAVALKKRGYDIYIVEILDWILPKFLDKECSLIVTEILSRNRINVIAGERVNEIYGERVVEGILTVHRQISCDTVIIVAGMKPRTELIRGLRIDSGQYGGIKVNLRMETEHPDIYACGDCVQVKIPGSYENISSMLWFNAKQQGKIAGLNSAGIRREYSPPINVISLKIFDTYIASVSNPDYLTDGKYEIIEKKYPDIYCRIALDAGIMKSIQIIGKSDELGILSSFLKKRIKIDRIRNYLNLEEIPSLFPWYEKIRYYLN